MRDHHKLRAFELADNFAVAVYNATHSFPREEIFGLTAQLRRAAISVPSNIVEGSARNSQADYARFLDIAYGSLMEAGYQLSLATRLGFLTPEKYQELDDLCAETGKVLNGLIRSLRK